MRVHAPKVLLVLFLSLLVSAAAHGEGLTYQGRLTSAGAPANGPHDIRFTLYERATGGMPISSTVCMDNVEVVDGLFSVAIPLAMPATSADSYISIEVRADTGSDCSNASGYSVLTPRQVISAAPRAMYASVLTPNSVNVEGGIRNVPGSPAIEVYVNGFWRRFQAVEVATPPLSSTEYTTPGVYQFVVPPNTFNVWADVYGGGGGGGDHGPGTTTLPTECQSGFGTYATGGGGGAGGSAARVLMNVTPGETLTITVGTGGAAGSSSAGGNGGVSRVRRSNNTVDIVSAPGGNGGGRRATVVTMGADTSAAGCLGQAAGGNGGTPGGTATIGDLMPGNYRSLMTGHGGSAGTGPSCYDGTPDGFCAALGGAGGTGISQTQPFDPINSNGPGGGTGANANGAATAGSPGRVYLWWD